MTLNTYILSCELDWIVFFAMLAESELKKAFTKCFAQILLQLKKIKVNMHIGGVTFSLKTHDGAWSSGIVTACGGMGREIEPRHQGRVVV
jgi:hypothetical protein